MCRVETGGNRRVVDGVLKMTGLTEDERLNVLRNNDQLKKERDLGKVFLVSPSPLFPLKYLDMHLALSSPSYAHTFGQDTDVVVLHSGGLFDLMDRLFA